MLLNAPFIEFKEWLGEQGGVTEENQKKRRGEIVEKDNKRWREGKERYSRYRERKKAACNS